MPNNVRVKAGKKGKKQKRKNRALMRAVRAQPELIWICLACGNTGCGRSAKGHAVEHGQGKPGHSLAYNASSGELWCYSCDRFLDLAKVTAEEGMEGSALVKALGLVAVQQEDNGLSSEWLPSSYTTAKPSAPRSKKGSSAGSSSKERPAPVTTAATKKKVARIHAQGSGSGQRGLFNLGNTCFFNSVLQNLAQLPGLRETLLPGDVNSMPIQEGCLTLALRDFMAEIWSPTASGAFKPLTLLQMIGKYEPRFRGRRQQDAHELLRALLENVRQEEEVRLKADGGDSGEKTFVDQLFGGELKSFVTCHGCMEESVTSQQFLDITAPIVTAKKRPAASGKGKKKKKPPATAEAEPAPTIAEEVAPVVDRTVPFLKDREGNVERRMRCFKKPPLGSLERCLFSYTSPERLEGDNAYICMECTQRAASAESDEDGDEDFAELVRSEATKQLLISKAPRILTLGLKRFAMTATGGSHKVASVVSFPEELDLAPFCLSETDVPTYKLTGIVVHSGTIRGGHYIALTKSLPTIPKSACAPPAEATPCESTTREASTPPGALQVAEDYPTDQTSVESSVDDGGSDHHSGNEEEGNEEESLAITPLFSDMGTGGKVDSAIGTQDEPTGDARSGKCAVCPGGLDSATHAERETVRMAGVNGVEGGGMEDKDVEGEGMEDKESSDCTPVAEVPALVPTAAVADRVAVSQVSTEETYPSTRGLLGGSEGEIPETEAAAARAEEGAERAAAEASEEEGRAAVEGLKHAEKALPTTDMADPAVAQPGSAAAGDTSATEHLAGAGEGEDPLSTRAAELCDNAKSGSTASVETVVDVSTAGESVGATAPAEWYFSSDSNKRKVSLQSVLQDEAYVLFYAAQD